MDNITLPSTIFSDIAAGESGPRRRPRVGPGARGFSLLEMLIVVGIILTIAAIAIPNYLSAMERARFVRGIADMKTISREIEGYVLQNNYVPPDLAAVGMDGRVDPWGNPFEYLPLSGPNEPNNSTGKSRKDHSLVPINSDYDLYSMGPDGNSTSPLTAQISRDDIVRGSNGLFFGVAADY